MFKKFLPFAVAAVFAAAATATEAMPLPSLDGAAPPQLTLVYGGCGPRGHRGPHGHCRPGGQAGGYWGHRVRPCPPGFHLGRGGRRCWHN